MTPFVTMLVFTTGCGACILCGGLAARIERLVPRWLENELRHSVIAFGGGILVAAVAFVLVPEGRTYFRPVAWGISLFIAGGIVFMLAERALSARR